MDDVVLAGLVAVATTAASATLVPLSRNLGRSFGIMDLPGARKIHGVAIPRTGGWSILFAFLGIVLIGYFAVPHLHRLPWLETRIDGGLALLREAYKVQTKLYALLIGSMVAFAVGLADDVLGERFPVGWKVGGQSIAALILVMADVKTSFLPYDWMNVVVSVIWLVGITNSFNLLDNMDGLAAGVAFIASGVLLVNAWSLGEYFVSLILLAFMGSLLGFLLYNFHPASVFLGDCGSHFIGYLMAALTLLERYVSHASSTLFPILMPVLILAVPLVDTATVVVIRVRERRPIYVGDRRHLSHTLVDLGFSQREAVLYLYLVTLTLGLGAAALTSASPFQSALVVLQSLGFAALILILMFRQRRPAFEDLP